MSTPPNPQRRNEKSRQAILLAALDLCAEQGYGRVTVEAIAARAGVSKKTIYRWWHSKGAVVLEALIEGVTEASPFPDTGDIVADLRSQMTALVELLTGPRLGRAYALLLAEAQHDKELADALIEQLIKPRVGAAKERLGKAQEQGQLAAGIDLGTAVELLYGPLYYRLVLNLPPHGPADLDRLLAYVIRTLSP